MFYCLIAMAYFGNETIVSVFVKIAVVSLLGISQRRCRKGEVPIAGALKAVDALRQMGKRLYFVTNNSTKSRQGVHKKFSSLGFDVRDEGGYVWEFTTY
jgi:hypothetical protein